jgi:hypothetical protein
MDFCTTCKDNCTTVKVDKREEEHHFLTIKAYTYTDKKENQIFLKYKEIQNGAVATSFMTNGLLIYGEIFAHFLIY